MDFFIKSKHGVLEINGVALAFYQFADAIEFAARHKIFADIVHGPSNSVMVTAEDVQFVSPIYA